MHAIVADIRFACRLLIAQRRFSSAAILALALGIGATNAVFTLVNAALIRPLPFAEPDRLVAIDMEHAQNRRDRFSKVSVADLQDWRAGAHSFERIAGVRVADVTFTDPDGTNRVRGAFLSAGTFTLLGRPPALGRDIGAEDDRPGAAPVVVIGDRLWHERFKGDPRVIGRSIRVNGAATAIVGVAPAGFEFPETSTVWLPISQLPAPQRTLRGVRPLDVVARLRPGVSIEQARADLGRVAATLAVTYPETNNATIPRIRQYRQRVVPAELQMVFSTMLGAVTFVLLIACANVANLLLARAVDRTHEISTRVSLGASRGRIVRQLLIESMVLAGAAGLVGLALSVAGVRAFEIAIADTGVPYWLKLEMDYRVFAFLAATSLGSSLVFGLTPAFHTWRSGVAGLLRSSAGSIASRHTRRWTGAVVVAQFALAVVLLAGAGLMMRTLLAALAVESGVATSNLAYMRIALPAARYRAPATRATFYRELQDRLVMAPGATDAALASDAPRTGGRLWEIVPDVDAGPRDDRFRVTSVDVGRGYFETVGATLLRGRTFTAADRGTGHAAAIINARLMETYFRGTDPIGRTIRLSDADAAGVQLQPLTIVGVVSNVRQLFSTAENHLDGPLPFDAVVYLPIEFSAPAGASVLVRTASPAAVASVVRQQVAMMDPDVAIYEVQTVDDWIAFRQWPQRVFGSVFAVFACIAVLLAAIGLYGVTACDVARRTREIGLRAALGARRTDVARLVGTPAAIHLALGAALGVAGAIAVNRLLQLPLDLVSVRTTDPFALGGTALVLLSAAAIAIWLPTRRAVRLDPAAALRAE